MNNPIFIRFNEDNYVELNESPQGMNFVRVLHGPGAPTLRYFVPLEHVKQFAIQVLNTLEYKETGKLRNAGIDP